MALQPVSRLSRPTAGLRRGASRNLMQPSLPSVQEVERVLQELQLLQAALTQRGDLLQRALQNQSLEEDPSQRSAHKQLLQHELLLHL